MFCSFFTKRLSRAEMYLQQTQLISGIGGGGGVQPCPERISVSAYRVGNSMVVLRGKGLGHSAGSSKYFDMKGDYSRDADIGVQCAELPKVLLLCKYQLVFSCFLVIILPFF